MTPRCSATAARSSRLAPGVCRCLFDDDAFRHSFLGWSSEVCFAEVRSAQADALADLLDAHLDIGAVLGLLP